MANGSDTKEVIDYAAGHKASRPNSVSRTHVILFSLFINALPYGFAYMAVIGDDIWSIVFLVVFTAVLAYNASTAFSYFRRLVKR